MYLFLNYFFSVVVIGGGGGEGFVSFLLAIVAALCMIDNGLMCTMEFSILF